jgi:hypothetical protein
LVAVHTLLVSMSRIIWNCSQIYLELKRSWALCQQKSQCIDKNLLCGNLI